MGLEFKFGNEIPSVEKRVASFKLNLEIPESNFELYIENISPHDISDGLYAYAGKKEEAIEVLQPHTVDVFITDNPSKKNLELLLSITNFKSTLLIWDKAEMFGEDEAKYLEKRGYERTGIGHLSKIVVYEYSKNKYDSFIEMFVKVLEIDIIAMLFVGKLDVDAVVYIDCGDLLDFVFYGLKKSRTIILPIKLEELIKAQEYLEAKEEKASSFVKDKQYQLF